MSLNLPLFLTDLPEVEFLKSHSVWADNRVTNRLKAKHFQIKEENIHPSLKLFFDEKKLYIGLIEVFYCFPYDITSIHSDRAMPGDFAKINWIFGGKDSLMNWYKVLTEAPNKSVHKTPIDSPSLQYKAEEVELIYRCNINQPSIVQVGCPHNIVNMSEERFCVSLVFKHKSNNSRVTMNESLNIFKDYIIQN